MTIRMCVGSFSLMNLGELADQVEFLCLEIKSSQSDLLTIISLRNDFPRGCLQWDGVGVIPVIRHSY